MCRTALLASSLLLPAVVLAQQAGPNSEPESTLRVSTHLVYVDVVARDSKGNVMRGLTQQDFKILEDGRPVPIDFFTAHVPFPATAANAAAPAPEISKTEFANFAPGDPSKPLTIVLFDLLNTPNDDQLTAHQQMLKFLDALPPGEQITVFALANGLEMTQVITGDPASRKAVLTMLRPRDVGLDDSKNETLNDIQIAAASRIEVMGNSVKIAQAQNYDVRAKSTLSVLGELARAMKGYPGRKSLYWLAESFPLSIDLVTPPVDKEIGGPTVQSSLDSMSSQKNLQGNNFSQTSQHELSATLNLLASARIAVYPVSVFGLSTESSSPAVGGGVSGDPRGGFFAMSNLKSEMGDLARETGGEAIFGTNDIAGAMLRTRDDGAAYYTLTYKPINNQWNGNFRKISVEAAGSGSLNYRRGYFATPDAVTDSRSDLAQIIRPGAPKGSFLRLRTRILPNDTRHSGLVVETTINADDVAFATTADGHRHAKLFVQAVAFKDDDVRGKRLPQTSGTLNIDLDQNRYEYIRSAGIAYRQQLALKAGKYRVVLSVRDEGSREMGTLEMPVVVSAD